MVYEPSPFLHKHTENVTIVIQQLLSLLLSELHVVTPRFCLTCSSCTFFGIGCCLLSVHYAATWGSIPTGFGPTVNTSLHLHDPHSIGAINLESMLGFHAVLSQLTFKFNKVLINN